MKNRFIQSTKACLWASLVILCGTAFGQSASWTAYKPDFFPTNASGQIHGISRVSQMKFHPSNSQKFYAVSARGGLFISTNGGNNWSVAPGCDNLPLGTRFASVCIDHVDDQVIYLGGGDHNYYSSGSGVWKSTNGGQTFAAGGLSGKIIVDMLMNPSNRNEIVAATNTGIYKTTDAGVTWTLKTASIALDDLKAKESSGNRVLFASSRGAELYRSLDYGETWTQITSGIYIPTGYTSGGGTRVAVTPADTNVVYFFMNAKGGTVFKSTDGGNSFIAVKDNLSPFLTGYSNNSADPGQGDYNTGLGVDRTNANIVYFVAHNVWKSTDGGVTWTQLTVWYQKVHTDMHQSVNNPYNNGQLWNINDGGVWLSTDGGNNWVPKSDGIYGYEIYHGGTSPTRRDVVSIGTQDNGELYATSAGWYTNRGGDWQSHCVFDYRPNSSMVYYFLPDWGTVQLPKRRLVTGSTASYGLPSSVTDFSDISYHRSNPDLGFVGDTVVLRTTNLTVTTPTWTSIYNTGVKIMAMHVNFADANRLYVVTNDSKIHVSTNALSTTPTFTTYTLPATSSSAASITSIKTNPDVVYITINSNTYRSSNNGATWTSVEYNLPTTNHAAIIADEFFSANELVFVATGGSVYYKTAGATTWSSFSTGLPTRTTIVDMSIYNDSTSNTLLRAFTYGRGVFETPISNLRTLTANFEASKTTPCIGESITYSDLSTGSVSTRSWSFPGGTPSTSTAQNPIVVYSAPGTYSASLTVSNGTTSSSITKTNYITTSGQSLPVAENFEGINFPPASWTNVDAGNDGKAWQQYTGTGGFGLSSRCMTYPNYSVDALGARDEFWSGNLDLSNIASPVLTFDVAYQPYSTTSYVDSLQVLISTNCGTTFTPVYTKWGSTLSTVTGTNTSSFAPTSTQWRTETINLTNYIGQSIILSFRNIGRYGNNLYIDNIQVNGSSACSLAVSAAKTDASCTGVNNGSISSSTTGGTGTITYVLNPGGASNTTGNFTGLAPGNYTVTATDANQCSANVSSTIGTQYAVSAAASSTAISCFGGTSTVTVTATNGIAPYTGTGTFTVNAGTYSYPVSDANGCTASTTITVTQPALVVPVITASGPLSFCDGNSVTLSTGTFSTYSWSTGETTSSIVVNSTGSFTVSVTNASGCTGTSSAVSTSSLPYVNAAVSITSNAPATVLPSSSITFSATHSGGGNVPSFQWKKNGANVGTNSTTYTGNSWANGDIITCVMTSNATCVNGSPATSNAITLTVALLSPKFVVSDITANKAFYYDATFNFIQSNNLSSTVLNGVTNVNDLALANSLSYLLDATNKRILRNSGAGTISTASKGLRTNTGTTLGTTTGLAISGDTLWVLDQKGKAVYRYSLTNAFTGTGTINALAKITLSNQNSAGESMIANAGFLYILNNGTTKTVYRYPKAGGTAVVSRALVNTGGTALSKVTGMLLEAGTTLYVTDNGLDRALQYTFSSLYSGTGNLSATASTALNIANLNSTGIALASSTTMLRDGDLESGTDQSEIVLSAYPNPTSGIVRLRITGETNSDYTLSAYDLSGRKVAETLLSDDSNPEKEEIFDLSFFGKGVYLVVLRKADYIQTIRVVVQ